MDGFKKRMNQSVQLKLSCALACSIFIMALIAGAFSFIAAFSEAHGLQDDMLRQIAAMSNPHFLSSAMLKDEHAAKGFNEELRIIVQVVYPANQTQSVPGALPFSMPDGLQNRFIHGEQFRVFVKTMADGQRIAVLQETDVRDHIARDSALRTLLPFFILIPALLLIVANLVRKMFMPIAALTSEIDQRAEESLSPVDESHLPVEVRPFVVAINRLLLRVAQSMKIQRRFLADAAHELRSPLTALSLQAEILAQADMSELARERLAGLQRGIARGRNLLDQLLSFASSQAAEPQQKSCVSLQAVFRSVLEDMISLANAKHIDIGVVGEQDAELLVSDIDLITLVKNLVDNAIRYTPDGGKVDLSIFSGNGYVGLQVKDSGPGISPSEQQRVFDPFYRIVGSGQSGSGLGLSIVKTIATRMGANIEMGYSDKINLAGLTVRIVFTVS